MQAGRHAERNHALRSVPRAVCFLGRPLHLPPGHTSPPASCPAGVQLFGQVVWQEDLNEHANFTSFPRALMLLFRVATGDNWAVLLQDCMAQPPSCDPAAGTCGHAWAPAYFFAFYLAGAMIALNLLVTVQLEVGAGCGQGPGPRTAAHCCAGPAKQVAQAGQLPPLFSKRATHKSPADFREDSGHRQLDFDATASRGTLPEASQGKEWEAAGCCLLACLMLSSAL